MLVFTYKTGHSSFFLMQKDVGSFFSIKGNLFDAFVEYDGTYENPGYDFFWYYSVG